MSTNIKGNNFLSQKDIDCIDDEVSEETSTIFQAKSESFITDTDGKRSSSKNKDYNSNTICFSTNQNDSKDGSNNNSKNNDTLTKSEKKIVFLKSKILQKVDDDVLDEFEYEEDTSENTGVMSESAQKKIERLRQETKEIDEQAIYNIYQQLKADIDYYKNNNLCKAIDSIQEGHKKEAVVNVLISDKNKLTSDFRNAWIIKSLSNQTPSQPNIPISPPNEESELVLSTKIMKYTGGMFNQWQEVICELYHDKLLVFKEKQICDKKVKNILTESVNFKLFKVSIENITENNWQQMIIKMNKTDLLLKFRESQNASIPFNQLVESISDRILEHSTLNKYVIENGGMNHIGRNDIIMESDFISRARTGDVVLFHTKSIPASIQRTTTSSKYDHVGIVVCLRDGIIRIFDAVGNGVFLTEWNKFVYENGQYQVISYRHLNYQHREKVMPQILQFVMQTMGCKYSISLKKFAKFNSIIDDFSTQQQPKELTYFCSELVAKCYKEMGILNQITSSTQYWPRSFSSDYDDKELILYDGAQLEREKMIILNLDLQRDYS